MSIKIYDLSLEPCPMNLVKFKYYFSLKENFTVILSSTQESAVTNITNFLNFKKAEYQIIPQQESFYLRVVFVS